MVSNGSLGNYIRPFNVTNLRCDGLVEYCYEWYNWPVLYDGNGNWDISNWTTGSNNYHSNLFLTNTGDTFNPVTQWSYMDPHY